MKDKGAAAIKARNLAEKAALILEDKKGENVVVRDLHGLSSVTDFTIVATGSSPPHLKALFNEAQRLLKQEGVRCYRKAGSPESGWMVLDYVDVVIHILLHEAREYYAIDALWDQAPSPALPPSEPHPA